MFNEPGIHTFKVSCDAEQMYFVSRNQRGHSTVLPMEQTRPGKWEIQVPMSPGVHRMRYYCGDDKTIIYFAPVYAAGGETSDMDSLLEVGNIPNASQDAIYVG